MPYRTLAEPTTAETLIKRSRFLAYAYPIEDASDAAARLCALRAEHPFATHVCYAYVSDESGNAARFCDDGEPKGTAGMPILEVLKKRGLAKTLVAVVRYFGGVKLGAGGLTRAYAGAAASVLDAGETVTMAEALLFCAEFDYETAAKFESADEISRDYGDTVKVTFAAFDGEAALRARLAEKLGRDAALTPLGRQIRRQRE